ncbi:zinc metalloprotease HtpX [Candidatus Chloroploca sp. M-50]|uniref:Protease HtpX homolog n=1 Tax=Candidatus Chloroploca mongolica TaxID=2528176 RepID=A0ABS4DCT2_9CHLR|nr:zinc metalloprotease HtpX [Candidatus Chloroploca mongolica]MBP1467257.1 zinc metalloprotease HtpX [Candidatus Chloroploca mongolica]
MQMWNTFKTGILLAGLTGLFVVIGGLLGGQFGMIIALVFAVAMNMGAWWFSDKLALKMSGAREVSPEEAPELHEMVAKLSLRAEIPKPRVYMIEADAPNAFATGRDPAHGAVAVTTGIERLLTRDELAGVIAHELAHIKHRDTLISSIAASIAGAVTMIADMAMWSMIFSSFSSDDGEESGGLAEMFSGVLMMVLAPIAAVIIQMAISRSREYLADEGGANILGDALPLASALEKLEWAAGRVPMQASPATSHLYIINPIVGGLGNLFRTHPQTEERIARLRAMASRNPMMA